MNTSDLYDSGKKKVRYIIAAIVAVDLLSQLPSLTSGTWGGPDLFRLVFTIILAYFLYKANNIARGLTVVLLILAGLMTMGFLLNRPNPIFKLLMLIHTTYAWGSAYLLTADQGIKAYFAKGATTESDPKKSSKTKSK